MNREEYHNAFSLIRWFFAISLVLFHGSVIAGHPYIWFISPHSIICTFFVMSGMLTFNSYLNHPGAKAFYMRRIRKILPSYVTVVLLATVCGIFLTTYGTATYLTHPGTAKYLFSNLAFLNFLGPSLPGVFESNTITAVNSSLWTMKVEVAFYLILPLTVALMHRYKPSKVIIGLYVFSVAWNLFFFYLFQKTGNGFYDMLRRQIFGQLMYFVAGMAIISLRATIMKNKCLFLAGGIAVWLLCDRITLARPVEPIAIAIALTVIAYGSKRLSDISSRIPNFTYEVYLLHFPVIQIMASAGLPQKMGFAATLSLSFAIILILAYALQKTMQAVWTGRKP